MKKDYNKILDNAFIRAELEDKETSQEYKRGYIKGVRAALYDLDFDSDQVEEVRNRLEKYL